MPYDEKQTPSSPTPAQLAFFERVNKIYAFSQKESDKLVELHSKDTELFNDALEALADKIALQDEGYQSTLANLKESRKQGHEQPELVARLREIHTKIKQIIVSEAGLPDELRFREIEDAKDNIASLLLEKDDGYIIDDPTIALEVLGIITRSVDGKPIYTFPYELMPPSVVSKWQTYLGAVCRHIQLVEDSKVTRDAQALGLADKARTFAHDSVTDDVHTILGLDGIKGWNRSQTRQLLANIRDKELPSYESALTQESRNFVAEHTQEIDIASLLAS